MRRALLFAALTLVPGLARAGDRPYAFVQGTDSLPDGGLEVENWFGVERPRAGSDPAAYEWWVGPVTGATDRLELGLFAIFAQTAEVPPDPPSPGAPAQFFFDSLRLQASWRPFERGTAPVELRVRGELGVPVAGEPITTTWLEAIASRSIGPVDLTVNGGGWLEWKNRVNRPYLQGGLGSSIPVVRGLRVGGELYAWEFVNDPSDHLYLAGPSLAYGRGRFWLSSTLGWGIDDKSPNTMARIVVGIVL